MKNQLFNILLLFLVTTMQAQTIVKMSLPEQAKEQLSVVVLFDEEVPEGIPVVLGLMGYNVTGGIEPYTFEWLQNGNVIGTGDIVVITPAKGDQVTLRATDKNKCYSVTSFNMKVIAKVDKSDNENSTAKVFPTLVRNDEINIMLPETNEMIPTLIRIFDMKGNLMYIKTITEGTTIKCLLANGSYFVSLKAEGLNKVEKIIVQH